VTLAVKATRSAAWMFAAGITTRALGLVGTLLVVRWVAPADYGEALMAAIVVGTASTVSSLGIGQFVIVRTAGRRDLAFHATVCQLVLGVFALGVVVLLQGPLAEWTEAPGLRRYLPALALSMLLDRVWLVPERALMRDMRFRPVALARSSGELAYTTVSLALAVLGFGGLSIALGNVARSAVKAVLIVSAVDRREWLQPSPLRRDSTAELFRFGLPLAVATIAGHATGRWDSLLVAGFFGPSVMAAYSLAYNLSAMAAATVAEHVIDIFVPSIALADPRRRRAGLLRGAAIIALVATPLCLGLAAVSETAVWAIFDARWGSIAPMLAVLSVGATLSPHVGLLCAYLQGCDRSRGAMAVQLVSVTALVASVATVGRLGPVFAGAAVGGGTLATVLFGAVVVRRADGTPVRRLLAVHVGPLLASLPMVGAVLAVRALLARLGSESPYPNLAAEVAAGAVAYCAAIFVVARPVTSDLLDLLRRAFGRRAAGAAPAAPSAAPSAVPAAEPDRAGGAGR
jgi:PST family polysaccharide transporter